MTVLHLSKRNYLAALLLGLITITTIQIIIGQLSLYRLIDLVRSIPPSDIPTAIPSAYSQYNWISQMTSFFSFLAGGFVVGWIIKERGWLYGGILGLIFTIASIGIATLVLIVPSLYYGSDIPYDFGPEEQENIFSQILNVPITLMLTTLGGYLGELLHRKTQKRK